MPPHSTTKQFSRRCEAKVAARTPGVLIYEAVDTANTSGSGDGFVEPDSVFERPGSTPKIRNGLSLTLWGSRTETSHPAMERSTSQPPMWVTTSVTVSAMT